MEALQRQPAVILAHFSRATMLALIAWYKCKQIPRYIIDILSRSATPEHYFECAAGAHRARVVVEEDSEGKEVLTYDLPQESIESSSDAGRDDGGEVSGVLRE